MPPIDAGPPAPDAGTVVDSGTPTPDATPIDASPPPIDAISIDAPPPCDPALCPGLRCENNACSYYPDCQGLLGSGLASTSDYYEIQPAAEPAPITAFCDMTTDGGGWTMVFLAEQSNYDRNIEDYTEVGALSILAPATQALLAYRDTTGGLELTVNSRWARIDLPSSWKALCPTETFGTDEMVSTLVDGDAVATPQLLHYGYGDWNGINCGGTWMGAMSDYGRICIENTRAPFFNAFDSGNGDYCPRSNQEYDQVNCLNARRFSIAVR